MNVNVNVNVNESVVAGSYIHVNVRRSRAARGGPASCTGAEGR